MRWNERKWKSTLVFSLNPICVVVLKLCYIENQSALTGLSNRTCEIWLYFAVFVASIFVVWVAIVTFFLRKGNYLVSAFAYTEFNWVVHLNLVSLFAFAFITNRVEKEVVVSQTAQTFGKIRECSHTSLLLDAYIVNP